MEKAVFDDYFELSMNSYVASGIGKIVKSTPPKKLEEKLKELKEDQKSRKRCPRGLLTLVNELDGMNP